MEESVGTPQGERTIVRDLAKQVIEYAHEPRMDAIRKRWRDVNGLRKPDRAPVWLRPVGCWPELLPEESILCQEQWLRDLERNFRRAAIKRDIGDDEPFEPHFEVRGSFELEDEGPLWGVEVQRTGSGVAGGAWAYDPPLKTEADFDKLRMPRYRYNPERTRQKLEAMENLLGDIAPVRLSVGAPRGGTLGTAAADLRGLEQMMVDMIDRPDLAHRLMAFLRDATLNAMDVAEATGLLTPNNKGPMTFSDPVGPESKNGRYTFRNCWMMANSQEFDAVSPALWEEFCLNYQKPIFERFGLGGYGCCENLTTKIDGVLSIPNLRIFVKSAWTDMGTVLEKVSTDYCIMWRQKASEVVYADEEQVRDDLFEGCRCLQGRPYQIVLRELQTLAGNLDRLHVWARHAIEAAEEYA